MERARPLAAESVQTPALTVTLVAPFLGELARVEVAATRAGVVDAFPVGEQRAAETVPGRECTEGQIVDDRSGEVVGVDRAAGQVDDLDPADDVLHTDRAGRVRAGGGDPAERRAGADVDDPGRAAHAAVQYLLGRSAPDRARPRDAERHRALDDDQMPAPRHRLVAGLLGVDAGSRHDGLVIIK